MDIGVKYFSSIMVDMKSGQSRLAQKYLHCEVCSFWEAMADVHWA